MSKRSSNATDYKYVKQMLEWGFSIEFVAKDNNIQVESVLRVLNRQAKKVAA